MTATSNEAAERLHEQIEMRGIRSLIQSDVALIDLAEALAAERRATVERMVALLDSMIDRPANEPRYRATLAGLKVARRAILDEEAAR